MACTPQLATIGIILSPKPDDSPADDRGKSLQLEQKSSDVLWLTKLYTSLWFCFCIVAEIYPLNPDRVLSEI